MTEITRPTTLAAARARRSSRRLSLLITLVVVLAVALLPSLSLAQPGTDDADLDGVIDADDNCPDDPNPDQTDYLGLGGGGDVCDPDDDKDGVPDDVDTCNPGNEEMTVADGSAGLGSVWNPENTDFDGDGLGDQCDRDEDGDGAFLGNDFWKYHPECQDIGDPDCREVTDADQDGLQDTVPIGTPQPETYPDNCRGEPNASQADTDGDGVGDACSTDADGDGRTNGYGTRFEDPCPFDPTDACNVECDVPGDPAEEGQRALAQDDPCVGEVVLYGVEIAQGATRFLALGPTDGSTPTPLSVNAHAALVPGVPTLVRLYVAAADERPAQLPDVTVSLFYDDGGDDPVGVDEDLSTAVGGSGVADSVLGPVSAVGRADRFAQDRLDLDRSLDWLLAMPPLPTDRSAQEWQLSVELGDLDAMHFFRGPLAPRPTPLPVQLAEVRGQGFRPVGGPGQLRADLGSYLDQGFPQHTVTTVVTPVTVFGTPAGCSTWAGQVTTLLGYSDLQPVAEPRRCANDIWASNNVSPPLVDVITNGLLANRLAVPDEDLGFVSALSIDPIAFNADQGADAELHAYAASTAARAPELLTPTVRPETDGWAMLHIGSPTTLTFNRGRVGPWDAHDRSWIRSLEPIPPQQPRIARTIMVVASVPGELILQTTSGRALDLTPAIETLVLEDVSGAERVVALQRVRDEIILIADVTDLDLSTVVQVRLRDGEDEEIERTEIQARPDVRDLQVEDAEDGRVRARIIVPDLTLDSGAADGGVSLIADLEKKVSGGLAQTPAQTPDEDVLVARYACLSIEDCRAPGSAPGTVDADGMVPIEIPVDLGEAPAGTVEVTLTALHPLTPTAAAVELTWDGVQRISGGDPIGDAVAVSRNAFLADGSASGAVLARVDAYPDALAGGPVALRRGGPLLLTASDALDDRVLEELHRLRGEETDFEITLMGGEVAITPTIADALTAEGFAVERIAGPSRFETALAAADVIAAAPARVVLVEGDNPDPGRGWPDAVSASSWAAQQRMPILLTVQGQLVAPTRDYLAEHRPDVEIVGGPAAISDAVAGEIESLGLTVVRTAGADRIATAAAVADRAAAEGADGGAVWLATAEDFRNPLVAGWRAAVDGGVMLLARTNTLEDAPATRDWIAAQAETRRLAVVGDQASIADAVLDELRQMVMP